ncbi:hypothetical protein Xvtw_07635 [Xanthomonas campestris pv. vitiswoodrowii]|nr:hypothetical protein Xvtw_07635 [Xanthomonas campestris pv. vitiswoodrowii]
MSLEKNYDAHLADRATIAIEPLRRLIRARHKRYRSRAPDAGEVGKSAWLCNGDWSSRRAHVVVAAARDESATDFDCRFSAPA